MPATKGMPSAAVLAARERRAARNAERNVEIKWFIDEVSQKIQLSVFQRVRMATSFVKDQVVRNISRPVTKMTSPRTGRIVVTNRSKKGEYPKADTTLLRKTIFEEVRKVSESISDGYIGTPLKYGLILETSKRLDRSFLARTVKENMANIRRIIDGPIK